MNARKELRQRAATILRDHFDTEASDAGLRSLDLAGTGSKGSASPDASAVARVDRVKGREKAYSNVQTLFGTEVVDTGERSHRRVRDTLKRLDPKAVEMLSLTYGVRLRSRDTEDGKHRKAIRQSERNWRVRLVDLYGPDAAMVLASPLARRMYQEHVSFLKDEARVEPAAVSIVGSELESAEDVFARGRTHVLPVSVLEALHAASTSGFIAWLLHEGKSHSTTILANARKHLDAALDAFAAAFGLSELPPEERTRSSQKTRDRILAFHAEHGHEIGQ